MIVYAVHNFEAENEDEINFLIGEPITVLEKDEKYLDGWWQGKNLRGETGLFPMNYTSTEKPEGYQEQQHHHQLQAPSQQQQPQQPQAYMPSPHLSSRSSGSTIEEEIENALSQLQVASDVAPMNHSEALKSSNNHNSNEIKVENWDVERVADWLKSVGLDSVSTNFIDQEITGDILLDLNIEALKELGINTFGKRYKIMQAITLLKQESSSSSNAIINEEVIKQPTPNTSVSTSAISRPTSRKSIPSSLRRSNSQTSPTTATNTNGSGDDALYQFPRKAPLPPIASSDENSSLFSHHLSPPARPMQTSDLMRPISPQSLNSSNISRSNTFNTVSSGATSMKSRELSPDPKSGYQSPRRMLSQKSQRTFDSFDKDQSQISSNASTFSNNPNSNNIIINSSNNKNDWMMMSDISNNHTNSVIHPLNTPTTSTSTPRQQQQQQQPMQISNAHKLSVSSFDEQASVRTSTTEAFQAPEHEGWLHKQSDKYKTWNKRWFVLKGSNLFYFKSPKDVRMKGIINLRGYRIIVDDSIHAGKYCFKAQHDRERVFYFYTDTEESMRTWLKMLMKTTIARDFRAPVMSSNHIATVSLDVARRMRPRPPSVIMYKNQKPMKMNNDPKMGIMLEEEEESTYLPIEQEHLVQNTPVPQQYRQTRESGITHPVNTEDEVVPELPRNYPTPLEQQQQQQQPRHMMMNDEEEDLIDPQHRSLPLDSSISITSSISHDSIKHGGDEWDVSDYINWINIYLPDGKKAIDLTSAFRNGDTLIQLLEAISHKEIRRPPTQKGGSLSVMMLDNIVAAFKFMGREGVDVDGRFTIKDVFGGNEIKIISMLDAIKKWADECYPNSAYTANASSAHRNNDFHQNNNTMTMTKKSDSSVLIGKDSGWRGSAMMDQRYRQSNSDESF